ncbi:unnamed protein product [Jaminaea pallidilutea]
MAAAALTPHQTSMVWSPRLDGMPLPSPLIKSGSTESLPLSDYLDFGSSNAASSSSATTSNGLNNGEGQEQIQSPSTSATAVPAATVASGAKTAPAQNGNTVTIPTLSPPPPGAAPEVVFRYYLKLELRKMGNPADDTTIDRYVHQHYGTFLKAMENGKGTGVSLDKGVAKGDATQALEPQPQQQQQRQHQQQQQQQQQQLSADEQATVSATPSSPPLNAASLDFSPQSRSQQPFKVPPQSDDNLAASTSADFNPLATGVNPMYGSIDPQFVQRAMSPPNDGDAMSEDGGEADETVVQKEEDSKDELAPLVSSMRFGSDRAPSTSAGTSSSRGSEDPVSFEPTGVPPSIRDSAAANLRPTAEEYRALSSKEKRQLRNKISARNFRERRKEYITHLEGEISDRDAIIASLRQQMSAVSLQNKKLEDEVKTLQARSISQADVQKILEALTNGGSIKTEDGQQQQPQQQQPLSGLRPHVSNDVMFSHAMTSSGSNGGSSRPSTPSSPRPSLLGRSSPALLPQHHHHHHHHNKDIGPAGWGANNRRAGAATTVAASA